MIRIIIVIDERETNILVSNALEISLISYANRMQISTFLPYARTGVKKKKKKFAPNFHQAQGIYTYDTRYERGSLGSWLDGRYMDISSTRVIKS